MPSNTPPQSVSAEARERNHESRNPPVGWILFVAGLAVLLMVGCIAVIWLMMGALARTRPLDRTVGQRGIIVAPDQQLLERFGSPHLQVDPHDDLVALRAREDTELNSYGWVDRSNGIVRLPIERAMDWLLERGLPVRPTNGVMPVGQSSWELIRERSQKR